MRRSLNGREKLLLGILAIAAVVAVRGWLGRPLRLGQEAGLNEDAGRVYGDPPVVNLASLELEAADFDPQGRNLFDYYTPPKPRAPRAVKQQRQKPPPKRPPGPPPPPPPIQEARAPQPSFRYLGYLGVKENLIAVFDAGGQITHAGLGDVVEREFKLLEFKYETVIMGYQDTKWQGQTAELKMSQQ